MTTNQTARYVKIAGRQFRIPASPVARKAIGTSLIIGGVLGFLPILGFWMIPLGMVILSVDSAFMRRWRRRTEVKFGRSLQQYRDRKKADRINESP